MNKRYYIVDILSTNVYNKLMISDLLIKFGLSEKEITVYTALIQKGEATATDLARATKINRTTIYSVCKELIDKGFISEDATTGPSRFIPLPPQDLKTLIAREEQHLQHRRNLVDQLIPELFAISKSTVYSPPKIQFKAEEEFEEFLYRQTPIWTESIMKSDQTWWGFQDTSFVKYYDKYIDWHWEQPNTKSMKLKIITTDDEVEKEVKAKNRWPERREVKPWPTPIDFTATTWVLGDYVVMLYTKSKPHYMIEIYDKTFAYNNRKLIEGTWNLLPKA